MTFISRLFFAVTSMMAFTAAAAFTSTPSILSQHTRAKESISNSHLHLFHKEDSVHNQNVEKKKYQERRDFLQAVISTATMLVSSQSATAVNAPTFTNLSSSFAEKGGFTIAEATVNTVEMKTFVDPKGLFAINVPKRFFAIRRTIKGDLPDEATGKGRRGSSIFTAGDMAKAEVVAVERFPTKVLLEEEGIDSSGDLSTFPSIGNPTAIANLITLRRDRDKQQQSKTTVIPNSVSVSEDGKTLYFRLSSSVDVQKPELLMEQTGVSELVRMTLAKATLLSNDGQMMAVFASALQQDYKTEDGPALEESVESFVAVDQSKNGST